VLELDLDENELQERIVTRFLMGRPFMCGGQPISPNDVKTIHINTTWKPSKDLLPIIHERELRRRQNSDMISAISDEWYVTKEGEDVTKDFIKFPPLESREPETPQTDLSKNIFIVHGRAHEPMKELEVMLREFGLNPIILHEQASGGSLTLVEKLEKYVRGVGYAFVILTPEDVGGNRVEMIKTLGADKPFLERTVALIGMDIPDYILNKFEPRARQNVIFEMGYFFALLGRKNVCCLLKGKMEKPTDIDGVEYGHFNTSIGEAKRKIVKELREAGYEIRD
jgi:predicted nucleotide-binding protein